MINSSVPKYRFSGHETFTCRYAWLPKAFGALRKAPKIFSDEENAIVELGVGKNMVRAIRFWSHVIGISEPDEDGGYRGTAFGDLLLGDNGMDPFLEDRRTLWLLHWKLLSHIQEPLFAWDYLINRWTRPEINRSDVIAAFDQEARRLGRNLSRVTLEQHFDVFLHTYTATRGRKGQVQEDSLDCPLIEIDFIKQVGERSLGVGNMRREPVYAFRREPKHDITPELFIYCLYDYWQKWRPNEETLSFRDVSVAHGSIGQVFKLTETDVRERLDKLIVDSNGFFVYRDSAAMQWVTCADRFGASEIELLRAIYNQESSVESHEMGASTQPLESENVERVNPGSQERLSIKG